MLDFLEEREYQNNVSSRARKAQLENESQDSYYYRRSPVSSAVDSAPTAGSDSENRAKSSNTNASSTLSQDPLSSKRFFDAVSGTVGGDRDYLPLVLLPDHQDAELNKAAMSLNALISSFNSRAISEETVLKVSKNLAVVAQSNADIAPHYAQVIMYKSEKFNRLYRSYRLIWEEYLDTQEQFTNTPSDITMNPVLAAYSKKLSDEITETEMLLVNLINSGRRGHDLEVNDPEYVKFKKAQAALKKRMKTLSIQSTLPVVPPSTLAAAKSEASYGAIDGTDNSLQLKLSLTLLVSALQEHSRVPLGPYIQGVREAMTSYPDNAAVKEGIIREALKGISVPEEVDLKPILHDILSYERNS